MKIVHFTSVHHVYDTRITIKECSSLQNYGHDVRLIAAHDKNELVGGIQVIGIGKGPKHRLARMLVTTARVFRECLKQKADIYHYHDPELMPIGLLLKWLGKRVIYDVHEDVPRDIYSKFWIPGWLKKPVSLCVEATERFVAKRMDAIVPATPYIANRFRTYNPHTYEIQNFPLLDELVSLEVEVNDNENKSGEMNYIAYIGSISEVRGIKDTMECLEQLNLVMPVRLLLGGDFSPPALLDEVRQLRGWQYVDYRGRVDREQFREMMAQSKVGLVVLHPEPNFMMSQPNKLFEYMSASVPVLASDFPLWKLIVEGNQCGMCIPPMQPHLMTQAIQYMLEHPEETRRMGENGRTAAATQYNWQPEGRKLNELYERLMRPHTRLEPDPG
ncbi:glycosyltransferase family 4 protein [Paenibacillus agricola]|uniref:Glycosyltransferase family 4 protein n=1 Tax=Paenibacillus agricola TaxID=2716264 RepID=A0ABX0J3E1_9BACL|nr:glycosyltransferase family 4 protein [Paenibacillus agricola]NHN29382.1 glycosyltransferase family 4 protein [Paenibacillus agricola]